MQIAGKSTTWRSWNRALLFCAASVMTAGLSACQMGSASAGGGNPPPPVPGATVSFCDDGDGGCMPATSFSVNSMRDLVVTVNWENVPAGTHVQTLEFLMPNGGLYQAGQTSFLVSDSTPSSSLTMTKSVPVAGAWIQQRRITGEWSVRVSLDGSAITSQTVQLTP